MPLKWHFNSLYFMFPLLCLLHLCPFIEKDRLLSDLTKWFQFDSYNLNLLFSNWFTFSKSLLPPEKRQTLGTLFIPTLQAWAHRFYVWKQTKQKWCCAMKKLFPSYYPLDWKHPPSDCKFAQIAQIAAKYVQIYLWLAEKQRYFLTDRSGHSNP